MSKLSYFWLTIYAVVLACYAVWSFSLTDPNLVLSSWAPYWNFQQYMWKTFFENRQLLTGGFVLLSLLSVLAWFALIRSLPRNLGFGHVAMMIVCLSLPLFFSYNALSHDVFNYLFNAKMVAVYHQDPHIHVALDFPQDTWTRFMHNTHTPAPYGYGWTALSLLPYMLGFGKFTLTWLIFRGINIIAMLLLLWLMAQLAKYWRVSFSYVDAVVVFLHPLVLIEMISNSHNDLWMLILAVGAFVIVYKYAKFRSSAFSAAATLFILSVSTKMATIVLFPLGLANIWGSLGDTFTKKHVPKWARVLCDQLWLMLRPHLGILASMLLFVPLLTPRSQLFHPWYLVWSLMWFPMVRVRWWRSWLLSISISSLFRYVPWLLAGGFSSEIIRQQQTVTWLGAMLSFCLWMIWSFRPHPSEDSR